MLLLLLLPLPLLPLLLLLLLLLGTLLVLVPADGAAWVRAALVRDFVCRTGCPTCSLISC
jgi:polyferredoxin